MSFGDGTRERVHSRSMIGNACDMYTHTYIYVYTIYRRVFVPRGLERRGMYTSADDHLVYAIYPLERNSLIQELVERRSRMEEETKKQPRGVEIEIECS